MLSRGLQGASEGTFVLGKNVSRTGKATSSEHTKSSNVGGKTVQNFARGK